MLALPYGQPSIMSSYRFTDGDQGPPALPNGRTQPVHGSNGIGCFGEWVCEHRIEAIAGMVAFRNAAADEPIANVWTDGPGKLAFARGSKAWVAINRSAEGGELNTSLQTGLPGGRYCDSVSGGMETTGKKCRGTTIRVRSDGSVALKLPSGAAIAIHTSAKLP
jgi:alpha-amylase